MTCLACERIRLIREQKNAFFVAEMTESYAVLADDQRYVGYTILLLKDHREHLHELPPEKRLALFQDVTRITDAVAGEFRPARINYECLGNSMAHIHWHVIPRYEWDPQPSHPIWIRPDEERKVGVDPDLLPRLVVRLKERLESNTTER